MSVFKDQLELAQCLREMLEPKFKAVYVNVNLASRKFYDDWEKWWGEDAPLAQLEIGLLFVSSDLRLLKKNSGKKGQRTQRSRLQTNLDNHDGGQAVLSPISVRHLQPSTEQSGQKEGSRLCSKSYAYQPLGRKAPLRFPQHSRQSPSVRLFNPDF